MAEENKKTPADSTDNIIFCAEEFCKNEKGELESRQAWKVPMTDKINNINLGEYDILDYLKDNNINQEKDNTEINK